MTDSELSVAIEPDHPLLPESDDGPRLVDSEAGSVATLVANMAYQNGHTTASRVDNRLFG